MGGAYAYRCISLCFSEGVHSWLGLCGARSSNHFHLVLRTRPELVAKVIDRQVVTAWLMICPKSPRNQDGTAKPPTEEEIRAGLADSLEGYQQVSIGKRLRDARRGPGRYLPLAGAPGIGRGDRRRAGEGGQPS